MGSMYVGGRVCGAERNAQVVWAAYHAPTRASRLAGLTCLSCTSPLLAITPPFKFTLALRPEEEIIVLKRSGWHLVSQEPLLVLQIPRLLDSINDT